MRWAVWARVGLTPGTSIEQDEMLTRPAKASQIFITNSVPATLAPERRSSMSPRLRTLPSARRNSGALWKPLARL